MTVQNLTPMLYINDVSGTAKFFTDVLGFTVGYVMEDAGYVYLYRDGGAIRFLEAPDDMDMADPAREVHVYVDVDDADAVFAAHEPALKTLPDGMVHPPFDRFYSQREFHVFYKNLRIFFGHTLPSEGSPG